MSCRLLKSEDGVSLVEMLVALLITGVILAALAQTIIGSLLGVQRQERHVQATALANEVTEELQAVAWEDAAFCSDDAADAFGGTTYNGTALVIDDTPAASCDLVVPEESGVVRNGMSFDVGRIILWEDDPADNDAGGNDPDGAEDYKRFIVTVTWTDRGRTTSSSTEALRAPGPDEQALTTEIDPTVIYTDAEGRPGSSFFIRAFTRRVQDTVKATYQTLDPNLQTADLDLLPDGTRTEWTREILPGQPFPNGETLFTFVATDPEGKPATAYDRALFLRPAAFLGKPVVSSALGTSEIYVQNPSGVACPFDVEVRVQGFIATDDVRVEFNPGPAGQIALLAAEPTTAGAVFTRRFTEVVGFNLSPGMTKVTAHADRLSDPNWTVGSLSPETGPEVPVVPLALDEPCPEPEPEVAP